MARYVLTIQQLYTQHSICRKYIIAFPFNRQKTTLMVICEFDSYKAQYDVLKFDLVVQSFEQILKHLSCLVLLKPLSYKHNKFFSHIASYLLLQFLSKFQSLSIFQFRSTIQRLSKFQFPSKLYFLLNFAICFLNKIKSSFGLWTISQYFFYLNLICKMF